MATATWSEPSKPDSGFGGTWGNGTTSAGADWNGNGGTSGGGYNTWGSGADDHDDANGFATNGFGHGSGDGFEGGAGNGNSGDDRACYNCGQPGHSKAECPNPRTFTGECHNCGKEGHMSKDCPDRPPRPEGPMVCFRCGEEGHGTKTCPQPAVCKVCNAEDHATKDCPERVCDNCGGKGHSKLGCENARKLSRAEYPDMSCEDAWNMLKEAVIEREVVDVKFAIQTYAKANPDMTFWDLEDACRGQDINLWLITKEEALPPTITNMDLQGNMEKKYTVVYSFSPRPRRPLDREWWPTPEENLERLKDAGDAVDRGMPFCFNCNTLGHSAKYCPDEKMITETQPAIKCFGCGEEGHRLRSCPHPHPKFDESGSREKSGIDGRSADDVECRKCGNTGHFAKDCPEADKCRNCGQPGHRAAECDKCRNCGETGHQSTECDIPRDMSKVQCRNCDEYGHTGRDCPKPRDYSRVKCNNCGEMGHTHVRCKAAPKESDGFGDGGFDNNANDTGGDDGGWGASGTNGDSAGDAWNSGSGSGGGDALW